MVTKDKKQVRIMNKGKKNSRVLFDDGTDDKVPNEKILKELWIDYASKKQSASGSKEEPKRNPWTDLPVEERYKNLQDLTDMVLEDISPSLLVTGDSGTGKSYEVALRLRAKGLKEIVPRKERGEDKASGEDLKDSPSLESNSETVEEGQDHTKDHYYTIKGHTSAFGLYGLLYRFRHSTLLFDDCDSIFKDDVSINLLKGALDSFDKRIVSWLTPSAEKNGLEPRFEFFGRIIFISNLKSNQIDEAVKSRAFVADITLTREEFVERMWQLLDKVELEADPVHKREVMEYIAKHKDDFVNFNLRTLLKGIRLRKAQPKRWKKMIKAHA